MKQIRLAFTLAAILLVIGVILAVASQTALFTAHTERITATTTFTTTMTIYKNVQVVGNCSTIGYQVPDTAEVYMTNVTITSGNRTTYSISEGPVVFASTETYGATTYTSTSFANATSVFVITSTSIDPEGPSSSWTVTVCTYRP